MSFVLGNTNTPFPPCFKSDLDRVKGKNIFYVWFRLNKGEKTISREDRNIRNNLVRFVDNLPLIFISERLKTNSVLMKNESKKQRNENS